MRQRELRSAPSSPRRSEMKRAASSRTLKAGSPKGAGRGSSREGGSATGGSGAKTAPSSPRAKSERVSKKEYLELRDRHLGHKPVRKKAVNPKPHAGDRARDWKNRYQKETADFQERSGLGGYKRDNARAKWREKQEAEAGVAKAKEFSPTGLPTPKILAEVAALQEDPEYKQMLRDKREADAALVAAKLEQEAAKKAKKADARKAKAKREADRLKKKEIKKRLRREKRAKRRRCLAAVVCCCCRKCGRKGKTAPVAADDAVDAAGAAGGAGEAGDGAQQQEEQPAATLRRRLSILTTEAVGDEYDLAGHLGEDHLAMRSVGPSRPVTPEDVMTEYLS